MPSHLPGPEAPTFDTMVREHWDAVYRMLWAMSGDAHDTEDLTQEAFLRAWKRIDSFQPGSNLRSWLLKIASNAFLDERRRRKRSRARPIDDELPHRGDAVGVAIETRQEAERIRVAMSELSELSRMVFHLRATEDLSFREIALLAGTTEQAARWHMHHARTTILKALGDSSGE